jgi:hypothetical protein
MFELISCILLTLIFLGIIILEIRISLIQLKYCTSFLLQKLPIYIILLISIAGLSYSCWYFDHKFFIDHCLS